MASSNQHHSPLAVAYAQSVLDLAAEQNAEEAIGAELAGIVQMIEDQPQVRVFLESPAVSAEERAGVIERAFRGNVSPLLFNFLQVVSQRGMSGKLRQIGQSYQELLDERLGKIEVDVTVPVRLEAQELEQVRQRISTALGKDAVVHQYVDADMIGGMVLRVGDRIIDASVKAQLDALRRQMLRAWTKR